MDRYSYKELREAVIQNPTFENCGTLALWLDFHDTRAWNGECYDLGDGLRMFPIYSAPNEYGDVSLIAFEVR